MIKPGNADRHKNPTQNVRFVDEESGENMGVLIEDQNIPLPSEGDEVALRRGEVEIGDAYEKAPIDIKDGFVAIVESIDYLYNYVEYDENGGTAEELFVDVKIHVSVTETFDHGEESSDEE